MIHGTRRRDVIVAGDGNDKVVGRGGGDVICGGGGRDRLDGGPGNDILAGGPGRDTLLGGSGKDILGGGHGADRIAGGAGSDRDYGGPDNDQIDPGTGADAIFGGAGADRIAPGAGSSTITPDPVNGVRDPGDPANASGGDVALPDKNAEQLLGRDASSSDQLPPSAWRDVVDPGAGDDRVLGSPADDTVLASAGNDNVAGGDGNDTLGGGDGNDTVDGGAGADTVDGGDGGDQLDGGSGQDRISAGAGDDHVAGGAERDDIDGGAGADTLDGGDGGDSITGGPDNGSDGADTLSGGGSVDDLHGGGGNDRLDGGDDADTAFGGSGDDAIETAGGYDTAYGDAGTDTCRDSEQHFLCEQTAGADDTGRLHDAPPGTSGPCDAWAAAGGDDANPGDGARPYRTVERLVNALSAGQTGCLEPGATFEEPDFEVHVRGGGDPGNPIVLRTAPAGPRAIVKGRVWVDEAAHDIRFENLNFDGENPLAALRGAGAALPSPTVDGDRIEFFGDDVTTNHTATCLVVGSVLGFGTAEDVRIAGNRVHDCGVPPSPDQPSGDHGIDLESSRRAVVENNYVFDNADKGILFFPDAQDSTVRNNVLDANRIAIHFGTAGNNPGQVPNNNAVTNNVITNSRLGLSDPFHWQVEGNKDGTTDPVGNDVSGNCFYHPDPNRNIQNPPIAFTPGANTIATAGPGYANEPGKDFRLNGGPGECARSFGPEDPPQVTTLNVDSAGHPGFAVTDRSRAAGSTAWFEARSGGNVWQSPPVHLAPGETRSDRVTLPPGFDVGGTSFQAVARSASGFGYGSLEHPPITAIPSPCGRGEPSPPDFGRSATFVTQVCNSFSRARLLGLDHFHAFQGAAEVPLGTEMNVAKSRPVSLQTMGRDRAIDTIRISGGQFLVRQARGPRDVTLELSKRLPCGRAGAVRASSTRSNTLYARWRHRRRRHLTIRGHYASGSARGTTFSVTDLCNGTRVMVQDGVVLVRDFAKHRTVRVKAHHKYFAKAPRRRR